MNDILLAMRERALMDSAFRKAILATAENPDRLPRSAMSPNKTASI